MLYVQFYILHGLPGSGKSTWAENFKSVHDNSSIITLDGLSPLDVKLKTMFSMVSTAIYDSGVSDVMDIVIDGDFQTHEEIVRVIDAIEAIDVDYNTPHSYHIKSWYPDKTLCMKNLISRLNRAEAYGITRQAFSPVDVDSLRNIYEIYIDHEIIHVESDVALSMRQAEEQFLSKFDRLISWYQKHVEVTLKDDSAESGFVLIQQTAFHELMLFIDKDSVLGTIDFMNIYNWYVYRVEGESYLLDVDIPGLTEYLVQRNVVNVSSSEKLEE